MKEFIFMYIFRDVKDDFIKVFHTVVEKALQFDLPLDSMVAQVDMMMRNHYRSLIY